MQKYCIPHFKQLQYICYCYLNALNSKLLLPLYRAVSLQHKSGHLTLLGTLSLYVNEITPETEVFIQSSAMCEDLGIYP